MKPHQNRVHFFRTSLVFSTVLVSLIGAQNGSAADSAIRAEQLPAKSTLSRSVLPELREVNQDGLKPHVDVSIGQGVPEGRFRAGSELGMAFGFQPYVPFGLTLMINHLVATPTQNGLQNIDRTSVLAKGTFHFGGDVQVLNRSYVGLAMGPVINPNAMYFGLAPVIGADFPIQEWIGEYYSYITVGGEARYLFVSAPESDHFSLTASMKYWF